MFATGEHLFLVFEGCTLGGFIYLVISCVPGAEGFSDAYSDTLCIVTNLSLHGVYCETFDVALRICVKPLRIREDLGPR